MARGDASIAAGLGEIGRLTELGDAPEWVEPRAREVWQNLEAARG